MEESLTRYLKKLTLEQSLSNRTSDYQFFGKVRLTVLLWFINRINEEKHTLLRAKLCAAETQSTIANYCTHIRTYIRVRTCISTYLAGKKGK